SIGVDGGKIPGGAISPEYYAVFSRLSFPMLQGNPKVLNVFDDCSDLMLSQFVLPECLRQLIAGRNQSLVGQVIPDTAALAPKNKTKTGIHEASVHPQQTAVLHISR